MNSREQHEQQLERWAHRTLRQLPERRAPRDLTGLVLHEIERRAALPWWRRDFASWPMAAKVALFAVLLICVKGGLTLTTWLLGSIHPSPAIDALSPEVVWLEALIGALATLIKGIPTLWIQAGLAVLALLYGTLFGLGTAAYRTMYARR